MGFYTLILLAGLQAIPRDVYEAAEMDGATPPGAPSARITLPLLMPNMLVVLVLALIKGVQTFDEIFVLTGGGPGSATTARWSSSSTRRASPPSRALPGIAAAASILLAVVLLVLTLLQLSAQPAELRG